MEGLRGRGEKRTRRSRKFEVFSDCIVEEEVAPLLAQYQKGLSSAPSENIFISFFLFCFDELIGVRSRRG